MKLSAWKTTKYIMKLSAKTQKNIIKVFQEVLQIFFETLQKQPFADILQNMCS